MVASIAALLATGRLPGRPRQTGQTWVLGSAPNPVGQPQNILVRVPSSTCVSSPITGSYRSITSSYESVAIVVITRWLLCVSMPELRVSTGQAQAADGVSDGTGGEGVRGDPGDRVP